MTNQELNEAVRDAASECLESTRTPGCTRATKWFPIGDGMVRVMVHRLSSEDIRILDESGDDQ